MSNILVRVMENKAKMYEKGQLNQQRLTLLETNIQRVIVEIRPQMLEMKGRK